MFLAFEYLTPMIFILMPSVPVKFKFENMNLFILGILDTLHLIQLAGGMFIFQIVKARLDAK